MDPDNIPDKEVREWYRNERELPPEFHLGWRAYGNSNIIRRFVQSWPWGSPLPFGAPHSYGPAAGHEHDLRQSLLRYFWVYAKRDQLAIESKGKWATEKLFLGGHPALYMENFQSKKKETGSLAVPDHQGIAKFENFEQYCQEIKSLPSKFHPITVCLRDNMLDCEQLCLTYGFQTVCSGASRPGFYDYLMNFFSKYEYIHTTYEGSPLWLAVLAGAKVFYYGTIKKTLHQTVEGFSHPKLYEDVFRHEDVDKSSVQNRKKELMHTHFGYRLDKQDLMKKFVECSNDFTYKFLKSSFDQMGSKGFRRSYDEATKSTTQ